MMNLEKQFDAALDKKAMDAAAVARIDNEAGTIIRASLVERGVRADTAAEFSTGIVRDMPGAVRQMLEMFAKRKGTTLADDFVVTPQVYAALAPEIYKDTLHKALIKVDQNRADVAKRLAADVAKVMMEQAPAPSMQEIVAHEAIQAAKAAPLKSAADIVSALEAPSGGKQYPAKKQKRK